MGQFIVLAHDISHLIPIMNQQAMEYISKKIIIENEKFIYYQRGSALDGYGIKKISFQIKSVRDDRIRKF